MTAAGRAASCDCGAERREIRAIIPLGGFYGEEIADETPPELDEEAQAVSDADFDPAGDPRPDERPAGPGIVLRMYDANAMSQGRMHLFSPRPNSKGLALEAATETDVAWPHAPRNCLGLAPAGSTKAGEYHLMHEFTTDVIELEFAAGPVGRLLWGDLKEEATDSAWATLAEALLAAGARYLDIDDVANAELGVTYRYSRQVAGGRRLILYDTAVGGAGYARAIASGLEHVFGIACGILRGCDCGDSCYRCLRSYRNQRLHHLLNRVDLKDRLARFTVANWPGVARAAASSGGS